MTLHRALHLGDRIMVLFLVVGLSWLTAVYGITARHWLDPKSVYVLDGVAGQPVNMAVDRTIKRPFRGSYTATIRTLDRGVVVCEASGAVNYRPDSTLPDPVTLGWWAWSDPRCHGPNLPPGQYVLTTTWVIEQPWGILPDKSVTVTSPPFTIRDPEQDVQQLQMQVDELRQQLRPEP